MERKAATAAIVITLSFSIGYLTYFGTTMFVDFMQRQFGNCDKQTMACQQEPSAQLDY